MAKVFRASNPTVRRTRPRNNSARRLNRSQSEPSYYEGYSPSDFNTSQFDEVFYRADEYAELGEAASEAFLGYLAESKVKFDQQIDTLMDQQTDIATKLENMPLVAQKQSELLLEANLKQQQAMASAFGGASNAGRMKSSLMQQASEAGQNIAAQAGVAGAKESVDRTRLQVEAQQKQSELITQALDAQARSSAQGAEVGAGILTESLSTKLGAASGASDTKLKRQEILSGMAKSREANRTALRVADIEARAKRSAAKWGAAGSFLGSITKIFGF